MDIKRHIISTLLINIGIIMVTAILTSLYIINMQNRCYIMNITTEIDNEYKIVWSVYVNFYKNDTIINTYTKYDKFNKTLEKKEIGYTYDCYYRYFDNNKLKWKISFVKDLLPVSAIMFVAFNILNCIVHFTIICCIPRKKFEYARV